MAVTAFVLRLRERRRVRRLLVELDRATARRPAPVAVRSRRP